MITRERWQQVEEVLQAALDQPPDERVRFLDVACGGDDELKEEAISLIRAYASAGDFIEEPAIAQDAKVLVSSGLLVGEGRSVGPYEIVRPLGYGGMGEVFLATDSRLGRPVALKVLLDRFASDQTRLRRFQLEARAASALNHPNILIIHEVGESDALHFIATEFIDGKTLRDLIADQSLTLGETLDIAIQMASAIVAAHAAGIVHRDIKPENVMRRADGIVKILDFGIAKLTETSTSDFSNEAPTLLSARTELGVVLGTAGYMSPEQARGQVVDERTDVWSLGVVLYEMLANRPPFEGATQIDTVVAVLEREPPPLFHDGDSVLPVLRGLQSILNKALCKDRNGRYRSAEQFLTDLKAVAGELDSDLSLKDRPVKQLLKDRSEKEELAKATYAISTQKTGQALSAQITASKSWSQTGVNRRFALKALVALMLLGVLTIGALLFKRGLTLRDSGLQSAMATVPYRFMSEADQLSFIDQQEQRISTLMGDRPTKLNEEALQAIKQKVDKYAARISSKSDIFGREDLRVVYSRAVPYLPVISQSFSERRVPLLVGIYLPMIESEYKPCFENEIGAKGLFQFLPSTARTYGVAPEEMCDAQKMTPAAAHYIADRMAELGDDSESMTLVLLSYNSGAETVRNSLRQLRSSPNYERNFWTLYANREKLADAFRKESVHYVPSFFAAAIIGENPDAFELKMPALSALAMENAQSKQ
jgi:serine/threonine protein kinase